MKQDFAIEKRNISMFVRKIQQYAQQNRKEYILDFQISKKTVFFMEEVNGKKDIIDKMAISGDISYMTNNTDKNADFIRRHENVHILFLELGVGANTPVIEKYPFWRMTMSNKKAVYACINYGEAYCFDEIRERAICIDGDIGEVIAEFLRKIPQVAQSPNL